MNSRVLLAMGLFTLFIGCTKKSEISEQVNPVTTTESPVQSPSPTPETSPSPVVEAPSKDVVPSEKKKPVKKSKRPQQKAQSAMAPTVISNTPSDVLEAYSLAPLTSEGAKDESRFGLSLFAGHSAAMKKTEGRSFSEFLLEGKYFFNANNLIGFGQDAKKLYEIAASGEDEFLPGDTRIFYGYHIGKGPAGSLWNAEIGSTLPVSKYARDTKHVTQTYAAIRAEQGMLNDRIKLSVTPTLAYRFNEFATDNSGRPLEKILLGAQAEAMCEIIPQNLQLVVWGKGFYRVMEEYDSSRTSPSPSTTFGVGSYLSYRFMKAAAIQVGMVRGTSLLQNVRYDDAFYDREATRYYAGFQLDL